ncbi:MAG: Unknown protein [uncultured Sulfurovum sp.]|uniref:Thioredoxin family protein n=1 Tax=uncultured Sulfurovum sp. TaxID=269237 RepID=A0A6S6SIM2_9BACT|nr:MAG: Unknown protein [uncultured Sulfurovum sp.]
MRVTFLIFLLLNFTACDTKKTTYEKNIGYGIPWEKDLTSAFIKAKKEKKVLLVMAVSDDCRWCEKMKKETLSEPKVAEKLKNYVLLMVDRDNKSEAEQLPPFKHVPIIFFMTHEKETLEHIRGYFSPEDFLEYLIDFEEN